MGTRTASPRGRYGERPQRDSVWRYICKNTTCWPATAHDVTTGMPQYKCRRENTSSAFSSSLTGLFEACRVNLVRVQFSNSTMASTSKAFRKCVDPCPRYLTPDDTHDCCVFCLGMEHARDVLEGAVCVHCERLSMRKLSSRLSLFSRKEGQPSASRDSIPTVAEARRWNRGVRSWMWPISWKGTAPFRASAENESELLDCDDAIFLTSSDAAASAPLNMNEFLEVMDHKNKSKITPSSSEPSFLHKSRCGGWEGVGKAIFSRIHRFQHTSYADTEGMRENGYERMPPVQEMITSLSLYGETSSLKAPSWPSKPLNLA